MYFRSALIYVFYLVGWLGSKTPETIAVKYLISIRNLQRTTGVNPWVNA
jgi:hypothetical protein